MSASAFGLSRKEMIRWGSCFVAIFALHCGIAAAIIAQPKEGDILDTVDAIEVDFSMASPEPAPPRDVAPGEEQVQTEAAPPPMEKAEEKAEEEPTPEPPAEPIQKTEIEPKETPPTKEPVPEPPLPVAPEPDVALDTAPPPPPKEQPKKAEKNPNAAPPVVSSSVTTAPTSSAARSASIISWKRKLAVHLQKNKRYPAAAQARREQGLAKVAFVVDRNGRVIESRLVQGSGSAALDQETLALLQRAQPLPPPPADVPGTQFAFSVPFRYDLK
ncbi:MAG TPA: energy transducer TonB [Xanthobacteraceae bacterium]|nr:energy transducer TonB [Xanthobacteraceae bacterium]